MVIERSKIGIAMFGATLLAGCATTGPITPTARADNWGEANRQTMAAQIIDPTPAYDYANPETSGQLAASAIDRVRNDRAKKPERVKTSTTGAQGNGGN